MDKHIELLKRIDKLQKELGELVEGFDNLAHYRVANDLSGGFISLEEAIDRYDGKDDRH